MRRVFIILLSVLALACSQKTEYKVPTRQLPVVNIDSYFLTADSSMTLAREAVEAIHQMLQDTLTDEEEGQIVSLMRESIEAKTINELLIALDENELLLNLVLRWNEEYEAYQEPTWLKSLLCEPAKEKPSNKNYLSDLVDMTLLCGDLSYQASKALVSTLSMHYQEKPFDKPEDTCSSLQSVMKTIVGVRQFESPDYQISEGTKKLMLEIFKHPMGGTAFQQSVINARNTLMD